MRFFKIGELAKLANVSVRSLHHYDEIKLLKPSGRMINKHRVYSENDVMKLQQIISLKSIGLGLGQIGEFLNKQGNKNRPSNQLLTLGKILLLQKEVVAKRIEEFAKVERTLNFLLWRLQQNENIVSEDLFTLMNEVKLMEQLYTKDQLEKLQKRLQKYPEEAKMVEKEWPILFGHFEKAMQEGLKVSDPKVQELAKKAQHFIDLFTGGDKEIEASLDKSYNQNKESALKTWGVSGEVFDYATMARNFLKNQ